MSRCCFISWPNGWKEGELCAKHGEHHNHFKIDCFYAGLKRFQGVDFGPAISQYLGTEVARISFRDTVKCGSDIWIIRFNFLHSSWRSIIVDVISTISFDKVE